jgi:hydroxymethylpyrimidine pyrophosphatase-like HAD family hydrolase
MGKVRVLAVDFDGTLATYGSGQWPTIGKPKKEVIDRVKEYKANNWQIILWTCRSGKYLEEAVDWCKNLGLEFDAVNKNTEVIAEREATNQGVSSSEELSPKIYATFYLDDKNATIDEFIR